MDTQKVREWADLLLKVLSSMAIIAGGIWAYLQFDLARTAVDNVELTVSSECQPYTKSTRLLVVHAKPKNIGKVLVTPDKDGFIVSVRSIPGNLKQGAVDLGGLPEVYKTDLMKRFPDGYELEPGVNYDEVVALIVPKHSLYAVKATFYYGGDYVDHTTVVRVE